ncbi:MAG: peptidoglycan-binding protein [Polyangiales bacterium]
MQQGECLSSIAERYGFFWQTLWNAPENEGLRASGRHPNVLHPGDVVVIPDKRVTSYMRPTGSRHTWKVKGVPAKMRLRLMWEDDPRVNEPYTLFVDGKETSGTTDGDGWIEVSIPPRAQTGTLVVGEGDHEEEYTLTLGQLDPVEEVSGVQARLANLGFPCEISGSLDEPTRAALRRFQLQQGMEPTGEIDDATRSRLREQHETE